MKSSSFTFVAALCLAAGSAGTGSFAQNPGQIEISHEGSQLTLSWSATPGREYQILVTSGLGAPWSQVATQPQPLVAASHMLSWSTDALVETRFYRIFERPEFTPSDMVWIWPGSFLMGAPFSESGMMHEQPQTWVTLSRGFWMSIHEVTQGEYESVTGENPSFFNGNRTGQTPGFGLQGRDYGADPRRPVERVNWHNATNYCGLLTQWERDAGRLPEGWVYRLPTEAEWEYACRAGTPTRFSHGDDPEYHELNAYAWYFGIDVDMTSPVGLKLANPWGLYDMHGNVREWCLDRIITYPGGAVIDLQGELAGSTIRGGHWYAHGFECRSAARLGHNGGYASSEIGFRVVLAQDRR